MIRLRAGKVQRHGVVPGGSSERTAPRSAIRRWRPRFDDRVGDVRPAAEDRDRRPLLERSAVGRRVDAEGDAADDGEPGAGELARELRARPSRP